MIEIVPNWHPLFVHFAIGLLLTAVALLLAAALLRRRAVAARLTVAGRWNLLLGSAAALLALASGFQASGTVAHDEPSHANMVTHMWWALASVVLFLLAGAAAWLDRARPAGGSPLLSALLAAGAAVLLVTGWYGGENVYRHGLGVMRLPASDAHHHGGEGEDAAGPAHSHDGSPDH